MPLSALLDMHKKAFAKYTNLHKQIENTYNLLSDDMNTTLKTLVITDSDTLVSRLREKYNAATDKSQYMNPASFSGHLNTFAYETSAPASDEKPLSTGDPRLHVNHENAPPTRASTYIPVAPGKTTEDEKPYNPLFW